MERWRKLLIGLGALAVTGPGAILAANAVGATVDTHVGSNGVPGHAATPEVKGRATCGQHHQHRQHGGRGHCVLDGIHAWC